MLIGITRPLSVEQSREIRLVEEMLEAGLSTFHLRKPDFSLQELACWLKEVRPAFKKQICWHLPNTLRPQPVEKIWQEAFSFSQGCGVSRIHFPAWWQKKLVGNLSDSPFAQLLNSEPVKSVAPGHRGIASGSVYTFSTSSHSLSDAAALMESACFDYILLSPVFDSISKRGYRSTPSLMQGLQKIQRVPKNSGIESNRTASQEARIKPLRRSQLIALGGIHLTRLELLRSLGYDGAAMLGSIWDQARLGDHKTYIENCMNRWNQSKI